MAKRKELVTVVDGALLDKAEALVRAGRSVPRARLPEWKQLAPQAQEQLVAGLVARGLELGEKGALRLPLPEQAASLSLGGARISLKMAQKKLVGASTKDRDAALAEACQRGGLHLVVRTRVETVVGGGEAVLSADEVERLGKTHDALAAVLKLVRKKGSAKSPLGRVGKTLLREDAAALLSPLAGLLAPVRAPDIASEELLLNELLSGIRKLEDPPILLVWIPDLLRGLGARWSVEDMHRALLAGRRQGLIELRQESGVGRLSQEEARLCPLDPDGVPLSHARRLVPF